MSYVSFDQEMKQKVSYGKQIARQHSYHKNWPEQRRGRPCKNYPLIYFDHRANLLLFLITCSHT